MMKRLFLLALGLLAPFSGAFAVKYEGSYQDVSPYYPRGEKWNPATIRVLIHDKIDKALLETNGGYMVYNPKDGSQLGLGGLFGKRYLIEPLGNGLKWGEGFPGVYQLKIVPRDAGSTISINGIQYLGSISIFQIQDKISVVNEIAIEDYITTTLSYEVVQQLPLEVVRAMAIAARTEAFFQASEHPSSFWHVDAPTVGYYGYGATHQPYGVEEAVGMTNQMVMLHKETNGLRRPFAARWTAHSAGKTIAYQLMYRQEAHGPKKGVAVPYAAADRDHAKWSTEISRQELARAAKLDKVSDLKVYSDKFSGKVYALRFQSGSHAKDVGFLALQNALGREKLPSSDFQVTLDKDTVKFEGYGKGEGVGMCLYAASKMAKNGNEADDILASFFPDAEIVRMKDLYSTQ